MSVNFKQKFPIQNEDGWGAIYCYSDYGAAFGYLGEIDIHGDGTGYCCHDYVYKLPKADGSVYPALNGGEYRFQLKNYEVYQVKVSYKHNYYLGNWF